MRKSDKNPNRDGESALHYERQILNTSSIGVLITRIADGTILYANRAITSLLGISDVESVIGTQVPNFYWDPADRAAVLGKFRAEGSINNQELRARQVNGNMIWVTISLRPFMLDGEQVLLSEITDITSQKQAEQALKESEERFRSLYNSATVGLYRTTPDGQILMINPTGLRLLGFDAFEELAQRNLEESGFEEQDARKKFRERLEREGVVEQESVWTKKDGTPIYVRESSVVARDEHGNVLYYDGSFADITEQKKAEKALADSESQFHSLFNATHDAIFLMEGPTIIDCNPSTSRVYGAGRDQVIGQTPLTFSPEFQPDGQKSEEKALHFINLTMAGRPQVFYWKHKRPDGTLFDAEISLNRVEIGEKVYIQAFTRDITERVRAEEELLASEERFRTIADFAYNWEFWRGPDGLYLYNSPSCERVSGYRQEEFDQNPNLLDEIIHPEDKETWERHVNEYHTSHGAEDGSAEFRIIAKNGEVRWLEHVCHTVINASGDWLGRRASQEDITERKRAEQAVLQNEQRFRGMAETMVDGLTIFEGSEVVFMNDRLPQILGYSKEDLSRMSSFDYASPEELARLKQIAQEVKESGRPLEELAFWAIRKDGGRRFIRNRYAAMYDNERNVVGRIIVTSDETERQQFEINLQRRIEIETLLTNISSNFVASTTENVDAAIEQALEALGKFAGTDRSYLFMIAENGETMENTHEWCAEGIESHIAGLKGVPVETFPWLMERLKELEVVGIPRVEDLPAEARAEKKEFQAENIQSVIVVPIAYQNKLAGFMGFDAVNHSRDWEADTVTLLRAAGETFIATIERIKLQKEILETVERRGYQVQISNEISQDIASAPELSELFERVVTLTKERFGYYHTQLLRYDPAQDAIILIKGYGETGQKMLESGHKMPMGGGLIGSAAATGETVMRPTLANDPDWKPNPLLPETKGEIAVPIKWKGNVLGVLDVQSDKAGALSDDDRLLLENLCGQIAVAMEETRLRQEMAERLEEVNRLYRAMSREGWQMYRQEQTLPSGFMFDSLGILPVEEIAPMDNLINLPIALPGGEDLGALAIPENPQHPLTAEDRVLLGQIAEQIALALEGARLTAQTQSALAQTEKLSEASLHLTRAADLQELLKVVVETLAIEKINRAIIGTFDYNANNEMNGLSVVANWWNGTGNKATEVGMRYSAEIVRIINLFQTSEPLFFNDTLTQEGADEGTLQLARRQNIRAVAVLPLFTGERQIGVLILESEEPHNFSQSEIRLFSAMGPQVATVLENRRQFERARRQAERESMLNLISQKIQSASSVDDVLQIAARELGQALGAPITIAKLNIKGK